MEPDHPTALGLATMAQTGLELGGDPAEVARDLRTMWEDLGRPFGAFEAAARAMATLPQRPEVPMSKQATRRSFERTLGISPVEVELAAALAARALLETMAGTCAAT